MEPNKTKIIVGLSGGVDSAVTALVLQEQGYIVEGLFMKNWEEDDTAEYCPAEQDLKDARAVCKRLNIPCHTVNFSQEYWQHVFQHFLDAYTAGRTPNPDILCNKEIKFKAFLEHAQKLGADKIATGHYAQIEPDNNHYILKKSIDLNKDQSYFLNQLNQSQLSHSLFPIGHLTKPMVRQLAEKAGFINARKKDSTGICFIGERKFNDFLSDFMVAKPGRIETPEGNTIGEHIGLMYYTLGQRQGLNIGGIKNYPEAPWYVVAKNLSQNILIVTQSEDHPWHFSTEIIVDPIHWITPAMINRKMNKNTFEASAKIRYRQPDQPCIININNTNNNQITLEFTAPQRAATPGQYAVIYQDDICLGGGIIQKTNSPGGLIK